MVAKNLRNIILLLHEFVITSDEVDLDRLATWLAGCKYFDSWTSADIYSVVHGRLPEHPALLRNFDDPLDRARHLLDALTSLEFRGKLTATLMSVFPEVERHFFVHVPRTSGTSLRAVIEEELSVITWDILYESEIDEISAAAYLEAAEGEGLAKFNSLIIRFLAQFGAELPKPFIMMGHFPIGHLIGLNLLRSWDHCFSVVRDPFDIVISALGYVETVTKLRPEWPDAIRWSGLLSTLDPTWSAGRPMRRMLQRRLLWSEEFKQSFGNGMTRLLGNMSTPDIARDCIILSGCKLVRIEDIREYIQEKFDIPCRLPHKNKSNRKIDKLPQDMKDFIITHLCGDDYRTLELLDIRMQPVSTAFEAASAD